MTCFVRLAAAISGTCLLISSPGLAQSRADEARFEAAQQRLDNELSIFRSEFDRYQAARANPRGSYYDQRYDNRRDYPDDRDEGSYDPSRYYRDGTNYSERALASDDRVYRGSDGRYYCKRSDGTTGLIVGAAGGAILGNVIDGGHSRAAGTLIGGALGALAGRSIDQNNTQIRCR